MVPRVEDNNPFDTQKTMSLDFKEEQAREGYMAGTLPYSVITKYKTINNYLQFCQERAKGISTYQINI